jgi:hypothetical protein
VVLPAYACPDLIAAVLWAQGVPEYCDLDVESLAMLAPPSDVVRIHVDAFGVGGSIPEDRRFCIVDAAQSYVPFEADWSPSTPWSVVSFGRAKPLSLTGGGALLSHAATALDGVQQGLPAPARWRRHIYNLSLHPTVFGTLARIPMLGIGQTAFSPLDQVGALQPAVFEPQVSELVGAYRQQRGSRVEATRRILDLAASAGSHVPAAALRCSGLRPLWRVPVICPDAESARMARNQGMAWGVSRLYQRTLAQFVQPDIDPRAWPGAAMLADRLITLPTHGRLGEAQLRSLQALLREIGKTPAY